MKMNWTPCASCGNEVCVKGKYTRSAALNLSIAEEKYTENIYWHSTCRLPDLVRDLLQVIKNLKRSPEVRASAARRSQHGHLPIERNPTRGVVLSGHPIP